MDREPMSNQFINLEQFLQDYDDNLFTKDTHEIYVMHRLLPSPKTTSYNYEVLDIASCKQTSNRLSNRLLNRFDNRLYRVYKHPTGCQTDLTTGLTRGCIV